MNYLRLNKSRVTRNLFLLRILAVAIGIVATGSVSAQVKQPYTDWTVGPYLQNPLPTAITICFVSDHVEDVAVEISGHSKKGAFIHKAIATPLPGTAVIVWKVRLTGLKEGSEYTYCIQYKAGGEQVKGEQYRFKTPSTMQSATRCLVVNDIHNRIPTLEALMKHVDSEDFEFSILLGDCWEDPSWSGDGRKIMETLAAYVSLLNAHEKPMLYVRGNHECRGYFSGKLGYLFDIPGLDPAAPYYEQAYYYSYTAGPLYLLFADAGEDGDKRKDEFELYRKRQADWLSSEIRKPEYRRATYHVFASHIPLYNVNNWHAQYCREFWSPVLGKANIDLALGAHDHQWRVLEKDGACANPKCEMAGKSGRCPHSAPYPLFIGGGPSMQEGTVMLLEADKKMLKIRTIGTDGKILATLNISS